MRKFIILLLIIGVAIVVACLYGVGHDQVTYSMSPEYYTKFKFIQFNLADSGAAQHMTQPRSAVVMVGVKATWWVGLFVGVVLGLFALLFRDPDRMFASALQAIGLTVLIAVIAGFVGYWLEANWEPMVWVPANVVNRHAFATVGVVHTFSYFGGAVGALAGVVFLLIKRARLRRRAEENFYANNAGSADETPAAEADADV